MESMPMTIVQHFSHFSHPLRLAGLEEGGHIEGKLGHRVVLAEAAVHLVPGAEVHDGPHLHVPRVPLDVGAVLAVAKVRVAGRVEEGRVEGVLVEVEGAVDVGAVLEHAVAPVDAFWTQCPQLFSSDLDESQNVELFIFLG